MKIRIEIKNQKELDDFIDTLSLGYKIVSVSKMYANRNNASSRVYIDVERK